MPQASVTWGVRLPLASIIIEPRSCINRSTYGSIRWAVVGPKNRRGFPIGVLAGPRSRWVIFEVVWHGFAVF